MKDQPVFRDERTVTVENASYRWGYLVVTYGLLILIALRAFFFKQSNWDLMALVVLSGLVTSVYQGAHRIFTRRWVVVVALTVLMAAIVAALVAFATR